MSRYYVTTGPHPKIDVAVDTRYPHYAVLQIGMYAIPIMLLDGYAADVFTPAGNAATAYSDEEEAWQFIMEDAVAMGRYQ